MGERKNWRDRQLLDEEQAATRRMAMLVSNGVAMREALENAQRYFDMNGGQGEAVTIMWANEIAAEIRAALAQGGEG